MSDTGPPIVESIASEEELIAPRVRVLLTLVPDADVEAALAGVDRQVYEPKPDIQVVGHLEDKLAPSIVQHSSLESAIAEADSDIDYLWILHSDARPRPDALSALVSEIERNEASLAGSKLLKAGTMDELESVGGATDVFGEPYSGLDEGEIDLQQYDVVREVAFVSSASMLVRRDLGRGLRGLDPLLPPVAAGLDFSQRTRLAGGHVITVPSSEVYHQGRCNERGSGWREQAGRHRAMLAAYSPLTLLWVVPYDLLVALVDSIGSLLLLRWRPLVRHIYALGWNVFHLPSTIGQRRRFKKVRSTGDEELFRFQASGSIRLRSIGEELSTRFFSLFDDDQALARRTDRVWRSPGIWGAIIAAAVVLLSVRSLIFGTMPNVGYAFDFESPTTSLTRWFGGWNDSGLGSPQPVHPSVGLTGIISWLWFGAEGAARTLLTIGAGFVGVVGMGRLGGRIGLHGPGRYLAGLVLMAGPAVASLVGNGSWLALPAAALLPWAVRAVFTHPSDNRGFLSKTGWVVLLTLLVAMFSLLLAFVPLLVALAWRLSRGRGSSVTLGAMALVAGLSGIGYLAADPGWLFDSDRRIGSDFASMWLALVAVTAIALLFDTGNRRRVAALGGLMSIAALGALRLSVPGPGMEEALAVTAAFGAALVVAAAMDNLTSSPVRLVAVAGALGMLALSVGSIGNGRLGLPEGDVNSRMAFAVTLAGDSGPGRILHASVDQTVVPGQVRAGPGFWYRVLDGSGTTHDEIYLPEPLAGDDSLAQALIDISSGADLRPGARLAEYSIDWVVLEGPSFRLDEVLSSQLDMIPTPLDRNSRVFENPGSLPLADTNSAVWTRSKTGFGGDAVPSEVRLAVNYDRGWSPDSRADGWATAVDGSAGTAFFAADGARRALPIATLLIALASVGCIVVGRRRR